MTHGHISLTTAMISSEAVDVVDLGPWLTSPLGMASLWIYHVDMEKEDTSGNDLLVPTGLLAFQMILYI